MPSDPIVFDPNNPRCQQVVRAARKRMTRNALERKRTGEPSDTPCVPDEVLYDQNRYDESKLLWVVYQDNLHDETWIQVYHQDDVIPGYAGGATVIASFSREEDAEEYIRR